MKLQNNAGYSMKDTGGVDRVRLTLSSSNILYLDDTATTMSSRSLIVRCGATGSVIRIRAGSPDQFQMSSTGIGFLGTGPKAKATISGAKGGPGALASLMTVLANYRLIDVACPGFTACWTAAVHHQERQGSCGHGGHGACRW